LPGTQLYLTRAVGPEKRDVPGIITGPEPTIGDIVGLTNEKGQFFFVDVPPGNYYLFIWTPGGYTHAQVSREDMTPQLIVLKPNDRLAMGIVYLPWP
jgi:hypothetical protein